MRTLPTLVLVSLSSLAAPSAAHADAGGGVPMLEAKAATPRYAYGARIGGYGFRRNADDARSNWDECRMNGIGVFGERRFGDALFVEGGLDAYFSESFPMQPRDNDLPIDRMSGLLSVAVGLRTQGPGRLSGYAQLGGGIELTAVSVPYDDRSISDHLAMPLGFLGVGGDVRIGAHTAIGANLRAHLMGNFDYDPAELERQPGWTVPPAAADVFDPTVDAAAQLQFYVRHEL